MKKTVFIAACIVLFITGRSYGFSVEVEPEYGKSYGHTLYHISGNEYEPDFGVYSWGSELRWPLDGSLSGVNMRLYWGMAYSLEFNARKNLTDKTGYMEDSDFFDDNLIIYSESDTVIDMFEWTIKGRYHYKLRKDGVSLVYGLRCQDMYFEASDVLQYDAWGGVFSHKGLVGTYRVKYYVPFFGAGYEWESGPFDTVDMEMSVGFVTAEDEDDHVLRYKRSTGEAVGYAFALGGSYRVEFYKMFFARLGGEYSKITARGNQNQEFYDGKYAGIAFEGIDLELESSRFLLTGSLGAKF